MTTTLLIAVIGLGLGASAAPPEILPTVMSAILLLLCSAYFSGSETALFSLQRMDRQALTERGHHRVSALLHDPRRTLASLLIGNETVNIALSTVTAGLVLGMAPDAPWLNVLLVAPLLLLVGEILPKVIALRHNTTLAPLTAPVLDRWSSFVAPIRAVLTWIAELFLILTGGTTAPREAALREAHLQKIIERSGSDGELQPMEQEIIHKVFAFGDLMVSRLMTPREDVFSLELGTSWSDVLAAVRDTGFSRIPMWQGHPDNIVGVLVAKKLLPLVRQSRDGHSTTPNTRQIRKVLQPPRFVPMSKRAEDLLADFRTRRYHQAVVVDEHGAMCGVVTLDDLLAELIGEMFDESDLDEPEVTELGDGRYTVRASMSVDDFGRRFAVDMPEGDFDTLAGFLIQELDGAPKLGAELRWHGLLFIVVALDGPRPTTVTLHTDAALPTDELPPNGGQG
jgi:CBS domain containing-hemolysin-like protein